MLMNAIIEKDDHGYFAFIPELKGCVTQGNTYEEVLANIKEAAELYMESLANEEIAFIQSKSTMIAPIEVLAHG
jgi:predicted RNase H-like HicB family nuclease